MLVSSETKPSDFIEFRFLPLAHALEVLVGDSKYSQIVSDSVYRKICREMKNQVPDDMPHELKESIANCLGFGNGRNLMGKITPIFDRLEGATRALFLVDQAKFTTGIKNTRNHFTHYGTKAGPKILQGVDLHWAIRKLALTLRIVLLINAGVTEKVIQGSAGRNAKLGDERAVWTHASEEGTPYSPMHSD